MENGTCEGLKALVGLDAYYTKSEVDAQVQSLQAQISPFKLWVGTQQEYNSLAIKDDNTLYFIRG
ncbi:MAG: hypothetical protein RSC14_13040 [Niameybacter sp.]